MSRFYSSNQRLSFRSLGNKSRAFLSESNLPILLVIVTLLYVCLSRRNGVIGVDLSSSHFLALNFQLWLIQAVSGY